MIYLETRICSDCTKQWPLDAKHFTKTNGEFYSHCKVCSRRRSKVYRDSNREKEMWRSAKKRAKHENLPFSIEVSDIFIPEVCPVLGIRFSLDNKVSANDSPSLDKIIPHLGYSKGNVKVISMKANRLKDNASVEELRKIVSYMESYV